MPESDLYIAAVAVGILCGLLGYALDLAIRQRRRIASLERDISAERHKQLLTNVTLRSLEGDNRQLRAALGDLQAQARQEADRRRRLMPKPGATSPEEDDFMAPAFPEAVSRPTPRKYKGFAI